MEEVENVSYQIDGKCLPRPDPSFSVDRNTQLLVLRNLRDLHLSMSRSQIHLWEQSILGYAGASSSVCCLSGNLCVPANKGLALSLPEKEAALTRRSSGRVWSSH